MFHFQIYLHLINHLFLNYLSFINLTYFLSDGLIVSLLNCDVYEIAEYTAGQLIEQNKSCSQQLLPRDGGDSEVIDESHGCNHVTLGQSMTSSDAKAHSTIGETALSIFVDDVMWSTKTHQFQHKVSYLPSSL